MATAWGVHCRGLRDTSKEDKEYEEKADDGCCIVSARRSGVRAGSGSQIAGAHHARGSPRTAHAALFWRVRLHRLQSGWLNGYAVGTSGPALAQVRCREFREAY